MQWAGVGMEEMEVAPEMDSIVDESSSRLMGRAASGSRKADRRHLLGGVGGSGRIKR